MPQAEVDLWSALRSYLNLQAPLAAVLRRPYSFMRQEEKSQGESASPKATVLQFRKPGTTNAPATDDQEQQ